MRNLVLIGLIVLSISSCDKTKKYTYVEIIEKKGLFGDIKQEEKDTLVITAKTDSIAYLKVYRKFCIAKMAVEDVKKVLGSVSSKPINFKLLDEKGKDISFIISFDKKDSLENNIRTKIFEIDVQ
ncbi:hypothetical protein [Aquimarina brevivitae]|uniref:Lipoprotein n=1 Tax=Aquimarina brevivitae TaxID=323412 RepID=A0A4Q7PIC7_9FLAO|nr:hypothetical protein [Aquimarina brevivitae]RZT00186.1 hypothetical protein EV197_1421 [Aquimarina brevivitae]